MVQGHTVCKWQNWLPNVTSEPMPVSFLSLLVPALFSTGPGMKACPTFPGLSLAIGPAPAWEGLQMELGLAGACGGGWLGWLRPSHDISLEPGSRHRGIQAACVVNKKPSGAPWDCSHLFALFPCKMLLTVLHQRAVYSEWDVQAFNSPLFFANSAFSTPPPSLLLKLYMILREEAMFYLRGKKELTALKRNLPS